MDRVRVSVCISVYNGARHLPRCLDSVCTQSLSSLEIVIVNDGSTDDSQSIIDNYVTKYQKRKIVVISQKNKGLAQGRQTGINFASGDYIAFLDQDDYVINTAYEDMLACAENYEADIVEAETRKGDKILSSPYSGIYHTQEILKAYLRNGSLRPMLWLRLYNRRLFAKPVLPQIYTNNEDGFALPCLLYRARSIYFLKKCVHTYSDDNEHSVMRSVTVNSNNSDIFYRNSIIALSSYNHFVQYIGPSSAASLSDDLKMFMARKCCSFIFTFFSGKTLDNKREVLMEKYGFESTSEFNDFVRSNILFRFNSRGLVKLLGIDITYKFFCIYKKIRKTR